AFEVYRTLSGSEAVDPMVATWWATEQLERTGASSRVVVRRELLQRLFRTGVWIRGQQPFATAILQQDANRLLDLISRGTLTMALTDRPLGDVNLLIKSEEGQVLVESIRYRASEAE